MELGPLLEILDEMTGTDKELDLAMHGEKDRIELRNKELLINDQRATYGPPDQAIVDKIDPAGQIGHLFKTEIIDGRAHPLMWKTANGHPDFGPITLGEDEYFVMGDNRDNSRDSRFFGVVDRNRIVGRTSAVA